MNKYWSHSQNVLVVLGNKPAVTLKKYIINITINDFFDFFTYSCSIFLVIIVNYFFMQPHAVRLFFEIHSTGFDLNANIPVKSSVQTFH
jgi:hypothetical protein